MLIVIKLGGDVIKKLPQPLVEDLRSNLPDNQIVLVHGGGDEVTNIAERLGHPQKFIVSTGGIRSRFTDKETSDIYTMVMCGKNNKELVVALQKGKIPAFGFSGVDGGTLRAERKNRLVVVESGRRRIIDGGFTGQIQSVNPRILETILKSGFVPVVAPVALGDDYEFLNVDSDRAAAHIAGSVKADVLIMLTDVAGVIMKDAVVERMRSDEAKALVSKVGFGMEKKLLACTEALELGASKAIIASGMVGEPITTALAESNCTVITR